MARSPRRPLHRSCKMNGGLEVGDGIQRLFIFCQSGFAECQLQARGLQGRQLGVRVRTQTALPLGDPVLGETGLQASDVVEKGDIVGYRPGSDGRLKFVRFLRGEGPQVLAQGFWRRNDSASRDRKMNGLGGWLCELDAVESGFVGEYPCRQSEHKGSGEAEGAESGDIPNPAWSANIVFGHDQPSWAIACKTVSIR